MLYVIQKSENLQPINNCIIADASYHQHLLYPRWKPKRYARNSNRYILPILDYKDIIILAYCSNHQQHHQYVFIHSDRIHVRKTWSD